MLLLKVPSDHLPRFLELPNKSKEKHELIMIGDSKAQHISDLSPDMISLILFNKINKRC